MSRITYANLHPDGSLRRHTDLAFTRKLFEEDRLACERTQRGVEQAPSYMGGVLLPNERLVRRFQDYYRHEFRQRHSGSAPEAHLERDPGSFSALVASSAVHQVGREQ